MVKAAIATAFISFMWGLIKWQITGQIVDAIGPWAIFLLCILLLVIYAWRDSIAKIVKKIFERR